MPIFVEPVITNARSASAIAAADAARRSASAASHRRRIASTRRKRHCADSDFTTDGFVDWISLLPTEGEAPSTVTQPLELRLTRRTQPRPASRTTQLDLAWLLGVAVIAAPFAVELLATPSELPPMVALHSFASLVRLKVSSAAPARPSLTRTTAPLRAPAYVPHAARLSSA